MIAAVIILAAAPAYAQHVGERTVQLTGLTNVVLTSGAARATEGRTRIPGFSTAALGVEASIFLTPYVSFGGAFGLQRLSLDADDVNPPIRAATSYYGPIAQLRLPLDERSSFVLTGSLGGSQVSIHNERGDVGEAIDLSGLGRYWLAGSGLSIALSRGASVDLMARYQSATFRVPGQTTRRVSAGVMLGIGVSVFIS